MSPQGRKVTRLGLPHVQTPCSFVLACPLPHHLRLWRHHPLLVARLLRLRTSASAYSSSCGALIPRPLGRKAIGTWTLPRSPSHIRRRPPQLVTPSIVVTTYSAVP